MLVSVACQSQTFRVSDNVLSTSLYQPFAPVGGYTLAFERMLDPGYSRNAAQFSYKINATLLSDKKRRKLLISMDSPFIILMHSDIMVLCLSLSLSIILRGMLQWEYI